MAKTILRKAMKQDIVWWQRTGENGVGKPTFANAVQSKGRWQNKQEKYADQNGEERVSNSIVLVSVDVDMGDYLYLGTLDDLPSNTANPFDETLYNLPREIKKVDKMPTIEGKENKVEAWL